MREKMERLKSEGVEKVHVGICVGQKCRILRKSSRSSTNTAFLTSSARTDEVLIPLAHGIWLFSLYYANSREACWMSCCLG